MGRVAYGAMRLREARLLLLVHRASGPDDGGAHLSIRALTSALGLTPCQIRSLVRRLESDGSLAVSSRFDARGGQLANAYAVTPKGLALLEAVTAGRKGKDGGDGTWSHPA